MSPAATPKAYPAGALVRASEICRNTKTGQPGLLPINRATWWRWVKDGRAPAARYLSPTTPVWSVDQVLALAHTHCLEAESNAEPRPR